MARLMACCGLLLVAACSPGEDATYAPDLLDHHVWPATADDWSVAPFSDQGAWFGFGLPPVDRPGGFSGPFLMSRGSWLGPRFVNLEIEGTPPAEVISTGWPGHLRQEYVADGHGDRQGEVGSLARIDSDRVGQGQAVGRALDHRGCRGPVDVHAGSIASGQAGQEAVRVSRPTTCLRWRVGSRCRTSFSAQARSGSGNRCT